MPPEPFFAGPGLDRADALRGKPERIAELARDPAARELSWRDGTPEVGRDGRLVWGPMNIERAPLVLGLDRAAPCFSGLPEGSTPIDSRANFGLLSQLSATDAPLFAAALSLANWHRRHPFCSVCGSATEVVRGGWSRRCGSCRAEHFPRADPVVIMLAELNGRVLLGRQPQYPPDRYSALAGFVEPGETIECAVARELGEEAGIAVTNVRYVASQPWPFPSSLMIGCTATALGEELTIDHHELDDARWFTRGEVEDALAGKASSFLPPPSYAIAHTLLEHWLAA